METVAVEVERNLARNSEVVELPEGDWHTGCRQDCLGCSCWGHLSHSTETPNGTSLYHTILAVVVLDWNLCHHVSDHGRLSGDGGRSVCREIWSATGYHRMTLIHDGCDYGCGFGLACSLILKMNVDVVLETWSAAVRLDASVRHLERLFLLPCVQYLLAQLLCSLVRHVSACLGKTSRTIRSHCTLLPSHPSLYSA